MDNIKILWSVARADVEAGAVDINDEVYHLYFGPGLPKVFDGSMRVLNISNIDNWISAKTQQRYSMRSLKDIMLAYAEGAKSAYSRHDVKEIILACIDLTVKRLSRSRALDALNRIYWIESSSAATIDRLVSKIRLDLDKFRENMGEDSLFNILCRIYKTCHLRGIEGADVCEAMASRLGRSMTDPIYPSIEEIKKEITGDILLAIMEESDAKDNMINNIINNNMTADSVL